MDEGDEGRFGGHFVMVFSAGLPPFPGKMIDFPGVYSCVDGGLVGLCACATFIFSSAIKRKSTRLETNCCAEVGIPFPYVTIECNNILKKNSAIKEY
jgi:hypothetical protein